ncbi:unnamed protein product [Toxocara canis]|uniref:Secreted protein n=1 Tax=Toxocara canis TaxID=6265 RepID=A0A183TW17_TOXCA|nr:unnamed protein product [Toxocara canis]
MTLSKTVVQGVLLRLAIITVELVITAPLFCSHVQVGQSGSEPLLVSLHGLERELVNHILERRQAWHCGPAVDMAACACVFLLVRRHSTLNGRDSDQFDGKVVSIFFGATIKELNEVRATTINNAVGNRTVDYSLNGVHEDLGLNTDAHGKASEKATVSMCSIAPSMSGRIFANIVIVPTAGGRQ